MHTRLLIDPFVVERLFFPATFNLFACFCDILLNISRKDNTYITSHVTIHDAFIQSDLHTFSTVGNPHRSHLR